MSIAPGPPIEAALAAAPRPHEREHHLLHVQHDDEPPRYTRHDDSHELTSADIAKRERTRRPRRVEFVSEPPESITPASKVPGPVVPAPVRQETSLIRGLQIPSRMGLVSSGFKLPLALEVRGVSREKWRLFTKELKSHAQMNKEQWATFLGLSLGISLCWHVVAPIAGAIPSTIMSYKLQKKYELENFTTAQAGGLFRTFEQRWNESYFEPLGLHVVIATPDQSDMEDMDVASTKLYRYQEESGIAPRKPGVASRAGDHRAARYQVREGHQRVKAVKKARIIVLPFTRRVFLNGGLYETGEISIRDYLYGDRSDSL